MSLGVPSGKSIMWTVIISAATILVVLPLLRPYLPASLGGSKAE